MAVKLISDQTTVLPNPTLSDLVQNRATLNMRRTMDGTRITYVKTRTNKRFLWTFNLTTEKAWELRAFVQAYGSRRIRIIDHKGISYYAYIRSNPIEFNHAEYDRLCLEKVEVTLEWEGHVIPPKPSMVLTTPTGNYAASQGANDLSGLISVEYLFAGNITVTLSGSGITSFDLATAAPGILSIIGNHTTNVTISGTAQGINDTLAVGFEITMPLMSAVTGEITVQASGAESPTSPINTFNMVVP